MLAAIQLSDELTDYFVSESAVHESNGGCSTGAILSIATDFSRDRSNVYRVCWDQL